MHLSEFEKLHFDIDKYLNPIIPRNRLDRLPRPVSHFLGYRDAPRQPLGNITTALWSFLGGFCGTSILAGLFMANFIKGAGGPVVLGSYGAAAILEYNAIESPFSQPRNQIAGQFLSSLVGVCITKLFAMNSDFENLRWLAGALSVGVASAVMSLTGTIHPPAGATALLAAVQPAVSGLGWLYIGIVVLSSVITTAVACLLNNIRRQYPIYWWTPRVKVTKVKEEDTEKVADAAKAESAMPRVEDVSKNERGAEIVIGENGIIVPSQMYVTLEERAVLEVLKERLIDAMSGSSEEESASEIEEGGSEGRKDSDLSI